MPCNESPISRAKAARHELLVAELKVFHDQGLTRQQACHAMNGKRGISWVKKFWPSRVPTTRILKEKTDYVESLERLKELHASGFTVAEAVNIFSGELSGNWVRRHWSRLDYAAQANARNYGHMDVKIKTVLVPAED